MTDKTSMGVSHYEVLGVDENADVVDVRKAYLRAAQRLHPDRFVSAEEDDRSASHAAMSQVNEAWRVLSSDELRSSYDDDLAQAHSRSVSENDFPANAVRIDTDRLSTDRHEQLRSEQLEVFATRNGLLLRSIPLLLLVFLLTAVFVGSALVSKEIPIVWAQEPETDDEVPALVAELDNETLPDSSNSGPEQSDIPSIGRGIELGDCVDVIGGPSLLERPCGPTASGFVVAAFKEVGKCPTPSYAVRLVNGATVCLVR